jgi:3-dehydroquinate synthetase
VLSRELGLIEQAQVQRITALVAATHLPTAWPSQVSIDAAIAAMQIDKKTEHGTLKFIVLDDIGRCHVRSVDEAVVRRVIALLQG